MEHHRESNQDSTLSLEARRALWDQLWARLLAPPSESSGGTTRLGPGEADEFPVGENQSARGDR